MSDVDKRVVQMDFDNKKFEKNVKQSTESVNNLKKTLNFDGVSNSIDQVSLKIKSFEIMTTTALVNITNQVVNLGIRMVKSLSVDNISAGWAKYGQKTTSVATMMAQNFKVAGREITDTSERMSIVTDQLERLSWFSDETSYTFTDMVDNVGKFIAAGQDLDVSVKAMEGIATWAALSGQNASTASRAMYQLAQAMGKGKIQLIDYKSIQNANMDTVEFRQTILEAAVALGELTKEGDKFVTKTGKKFTKNQFAEELSSGWFTSKVLVEGLSKYSAAVDQIYELANKEGITASEVIEKYGDTLDTFGLKAFKAAQEARTFSDVLNSVRDAVSSKWMETAEMIFGNKDEAIELWTELANALYEVFAEAGNFRNEILKVWKALGGREDLFKRGGPDQGAFWNIYDAIVNLKKLIKSAWNTIFPLSQMEDESDQAREIGSNLKTLTKSFQAFTKKLEMSEVTSLRLRKIFEGLFSILKFGIQVLNAIRYILDPIFELGKKLISVVLDKIVGLINSVQISGEFLFKTAEKINDVITSIFDASFDFSGILGSIVNLLKTLGSAIGKLFKQLFEFIKQSKVFISISDVIQKFINNVAKGIEKIQPLLNSLLNVVKKVIKVLLQIPRALNNISKSLTGKGIIENLATFLDRIVELFDKFEQGLSTNGSIGNGFVILSPLEHFFYGLGTFLNGLFTIIKSLVLVVGKVLEVIGKIFTGLGNLITNAIQGTLKIDKKIVILLSILTPLAVVIGAAVSMALNIGWMITAIKNPLGVIADSVSGILDKISLQMLANAIKTFAEAILDISVSLLILAGIGSDAGKLWSAVGALAVISVILTGVIAALFLIGKKAKTVTRSVKTVKKQAVTIRQSIIGVMDEVKSTVASLKQLAGIAMMGDLLRAFSTAFLKIAASLYIISKIEIKDIIKGCAVMVAMLAEIWLLVKAVGNKKVDIKKATPTIMQMLAFSILIKSFANALKSFKGLEEDERINVEIAFLAIAGFIGILWLMIRDINQKKIKPDSMKSISLLLLSIGAMVLSFSKSLTNMSKITGEDGKAGWRAVGYILALVVPLMAGLIALNKLGVVSKKFKFNKIEYQIASISLLLLSLASAMKTIGGIQWDAGGRAVGYILLFIVPLLGMLILLNRFSAIAKNKQISEVTKQILSISVLLLAFGSVIKNLEHVDYTKGSIYVGLVTGFMAVLLTMLLLLNRYGTYLGSGINNGLSNQLSALIGILLIFGVLIKVLEKTDYVAGSVYAGLIVAFLFAITGVLWALNSIEIKNSKNILVQLFGISLLLLSFAKSMKMLTIVPWQDILTATLGLAAVLLSVLGLESVLAHIGKTGTDVLKDMAGISGGLILLAGSLLILATSFQIFSNIGWETIGKGAVVVGGALILLATIAALLSRAKVETTLLALSGSMVLVGVGMLTAAIAIQVLVNALATISQMSTTSIQAASDNLNALAQVISTALLAGLQTLFNDLNTLLPSMFESINTIIDNVLSLLSEKGPIISQTLISILDKFLADLDEHAESIFNSVMSILNKLLTSLDNNAESISNKLVDILLKIIKTAGKRADDIIAGILSFAIDLIKGLLKNEQLLKELVSNLLKFIMSAIIGIAQNIVGLAGAIAKVLLILLSAALQIVTASLGGLASLMLEFITAFLLVLVHTVIGMQRIIYQTFKTIVFNVIDILNKVLMDVGPMLAVMLKTGFNSLLAGILEAIAILIKDIPVVNLLYDPIHNAAENMKAGVKNTMDEYADIMRGDNVISALKQANSNITSTVKQSMSAMKDTTTDVMNDINSAMTDSMSKLGDTMTDLAKQATNGFNMTLNDGIDEAKQTGVDLGDAVAEGVASAESLDIHSPSRKMAKLGIYAIQGLINSIDEKKDEVVDTMTSMVSNAVNATQDTIENQNGDDLTIKVGMDISGVEAQSKKITDIMTGINKVDTTVYGKNALYASRSTRKSNSEQSVTNTDNSSNVTYNNVFNVSSTDPQRSADEIDKVLNRQAIKARLARGAI
ncbi:MAG: tape measure protein [Lactobacillus johnsonii]|nr:tape measure protein [Lactobacillus johnsonii]